jgi:anaerobic ribonucleoside-triphosphate reductase activating protein
MKEHPDHVSLCFEITGCPFVCAGCHSPELQSDIGQELTGDIFESILLRYKGLIDCVMFFGGDQYGFELVEFLNIAKARGLKTCLWTGSINVSFSILRLLNYIKIGQYVPEFGPLGSPNTNQKYINLTTGEDICLK